jgi:predicted aldo/keto reductase-like oxidoreductase
MKRTKGFSRREFLGTAVAGAAGIGLTSLGRLEAGQAKAAPAPGTKAATPAPGKLLTRTLGRTGLRIPVVSMGVMNSDIPQLVKRAYDLGLTHFDTAASYWRGKNEEMVGQAIREMGVRDKTVIATKIMAPEIRQRLDRTRTKATYLEMLEASLKRLRMDHVEIVYVHDVSDPKDVSDQGLLEGMAAAKKQGKTRAVGFSTHREMAACLEEAMKVGTYDAVLTTYNYSLEPYPVILKTMEKAVASGIGLVAMKTQCQQEWYREELPPELQAYYKGTMVHSALLKWVLNHPCFTTAVPGFTAVDQLEEDAACALSLDYTPAERKFLEDRKVKLALSAACRQCASCLATCPKGADVPNLMRAHMYAFSYGNPVQARDTLDEPGVRESLRRCGDCTSCLAVCSGRVPIGRRITQLRQIFA